jgi:HK97 family phage prohead protease
MKKDSNSYQVKSQNLKIKDLDEGNRQVVIYLSDFDSLDSDNDIIRKGAFKKSIMERGPNSSSNRKIAFLRHHNWEMPIGKFLELSEDEKGLYAVAKLSSSTDGMNAMADYEEGIIREHSIGFKYMKDKIRFIEEESMENGGYYEVNEVQLYEGSAVTFGANEFTEVMDVTKTEDKIELATKISEEIGCLATSLSKGKGTDERLYGYEMKLKYLNSRLLDLAKTEPFEKHSVKSKPNEIILPFDWSKVKIN